jgi:hypothetical protein
LARGVLGVDCADEVGGFAVCDLDEAVIYF